MEEKPGLTRALKAEAQRLGFVLAGVTTPEPPPHFEVFARWTEQGLGGEMGYLSTQRSLERRADPRQILPECRSILALAAPYHPAHREEPADSSGPTGRVAAYAWGRDYHDVLPERLQALVAFLEGELGRPVPNRWYTDTGPLLERDLAQRAGLGWAGKNTCLIHPRHGSYFLLAEILLGVELEIDPPFTADLCGTCTRCIEACPTSCILPDRTIDARRCISYLTIELKGAMPVELRPQVQDWVFGCDVCQQVCPWNLRFAAGPGDLAFAPQERPTRTDLIQDLETLAPEEFNRRFKGSPVKRAKRRGFLRNTAVALGNAAGSGPAAPGESREAVAALARALQDAEPLVRRHAAWALGQAGGDEARRALEAALQSESDAEVIAEIRLALA